MTNHQLNSGQSYADLIALKRLKETKNSLHFPREYIYNFYGNGASEVMRKRQTSEPYVYIEFPDVDHLCHVFRTDIAFETFRFYLGCHEPL